MGGGGGGGGGGGSEIKVFVRFSCAMPPSDLVQSLSKTDEKQFLISHCQAIYGEDEQFVGSGPLHRTTPSNPLGSNGDRIRAASSQG